MTRGLTGSSLGAKGPFSSAIINMAPPTFVGK